MWIEKVINSKGIRYKFCERFLNPNTNKMIKLSVTLNSNTTHAKRKATELLQARFYDVLNKAEKKQLEKINSLTFIQVATEWLEYSSSCIKVSTILNHKNYIKRIEKAISNMLFVDFTPAIAEKIIFDMYYTEKLSYSYSNATLIIIKSIMRYAKKSKYVQDISDFIDIKLRKRTATKKEVQRLQNKFLNADELKSCLQQLKEINPRIGLAMEFIALTGLRCGELLALRVQDYYKDKSIININGTIIKSARNGEDTQRGTPKNSYSYRDVIINDRAKYILDSIILENKKLASWNSKKYKDKGYIFTTSTGNPFTECKAPSSRPEKFRSSSWTESMRSPSALETPPWDRPTTPSCVCADGVPRRDMPHTNETSPVEYAWPPQWSGSPASIGSAMRLLCCIPGAPHPPAAGRK